MADFAAGGGGGIICYADLRIAISQPQAQFLSLPVRPYKGTSTIIDWSNTMCHDCALASRVRRLLRTVHEPGHGVASIFPAITKSWIQIASPERNSDVMMVSSSPQTPHWNCSTRFAIR